MTRPSGSDRGVLPYLRVGLVVLLVVLAVPVVGDVLSGPPTVEGSTPERPEVTPSNRTGSITVVTIDALGPGQIAAFDTNGSLLYRNRTYGIYHDVDPSPRGEATVTYVASRGHQPASKCEGDSKCMLNVVERVNLTTGNVTRLYTRYSPNTGSTQIHDVDRVNESVLLVGDIIFPDGVYMMNTTTGERIWQWNVSEAYAPDSGGRYPNDWTHINDVEYLHDGRVMVNLRNQDQVVFLDPGRGLQENWTLGTDDAHDTLFEQHNSDYIPREHGGPAVLIADSENNRIVEYQRVDGAWERTWNWQDPQLEWPRDADRLPNGHTLVVDSHGQRLLVVNRTGTVVRERSFPDGGYDIERLGTGDESTGGPSMYALREGSNTTTTPASVDGPESAASGIETFLTGLYPSLVLHGFLFVLPDRISPLGGAALLSQLLLAGMWGVVELSVYVRHRR